MLPFYIKAGSDNPKKIKSIFTKILKWKFLSCPGGIFWTPS